MSGRNGKPKVVVLDYGAGNLRSVVRAVEHVAGTAGVDVQVSDDFCALDTADACILPGVGAAEDTMNNLDARGLSGPVTQYIDSGRPFLGVCMGLQALMTASEEGGEFGAASSFFGPFRCLGLLLDHNGDPNLGTYYGLTPLVLASAGRPLQKGRRQRRRPLPAWRIGSPSGAPSLS